MTLAEINKLVDQLAGNPDCGTVTLLQLPISWVILTDQYVYKIKKPVKYSYLDFSTPEKRRFFCERELVLNQRLTTGMYLEVVPVVRDSGGGVKLREEGAVLDYALVMQRMDEKRQMDRLLAAGKVTPHQLDQLAVQLADFHRKANRIKGQNDIHQQHQRFADIRTQEDDWLCHWGEAERKLVDASIAWSDAFLQQHERRFYEREAAGWVVDGHGDLHAGNIFLLDQPVIFDCIEFNDDLRIVDVLSEIAFFIMDLDVRGYAESGAYFFAAYQRAFPCVEQEADQRIFHYYKVYRANVRLKVLLHHYLLATDIVQQMPVRQEIDRYLKLYRQYLDDPLAALQQR
ncbi:MAG: phosphotransferase [Lewinellaceae bacterium]|nr:phosphotransferase [Lewinellaceae bacterium]